MCLQVLADSGEVSLQPVHFGMPVVTVTQDIVQVEVQDVGMEAADLQVVLGGRWRGQRSSYVWRTLFVMLLILLW